MTDPVRFASNLRVTIQALGWRSGGRYLPLQDHGEESPSLRRRPGGSNYFLHDGQVVPCLRMASIPPQLIVFSGAGLSAESGLPTFRGASGLWEGVPIQVVCDISTWEENFDAVHAFYDARRAAGGKARPNDAHRAIAAWQKTWPGRTTILTQNIDRLLEGAGCTNVIKLHGDIRTLRCLACGHDWEIEGDRYDRKGCPSCARTELVKPGVVFFGEAAPHYDDLHRVVSELRAIDTVVVVGTSGTVLPADQLFGRSRAFSILVNLEPASQMNEKLFSERRYGPATQQLPLLGGLLKERMG
jgi:NAD-dependent deacetylase